LQFETSSIKFTPLFKEVSGLSNKDLITSHLTMVNEVGRKILTTPNIETLYTEITNILQQTFNFHHLSLWIYDVKTQEAILKAKSGVAPYQDEIGQRRSMDIGIIGWCLKSGKTILANDVTQDPHYYHYPGLQTKSELCARIKIYDQVIGALNVESDKLNAFEESDVTVLETTADLCALAIYLTNFNKELEHQVEEKTAELRAANEKIMQQQQLLKHENKSLKSFIDQKIPSLKIIGSSKPLMQLLSMVDKIAPTQATVLIQGESGTGKELIAHRLHDMSDRKNAPYVTINCGALHENLLKSELFGHEKGSFTGAHALKIGLVETAHGGTLFLDEIGEMGKEMQAKLLRFLQEGEFYRIGGKKPLKVNVRVLSATNKDLETEVKEGRFREDLYYRLNTITLRVPPLRKRLDDIDHLVDHFLKSDLWGESKVKKISSEAQELLKQYDWPGNIRELQNVLERLKILSDGDTITVEDMATHIKFSNKAAVETSDYLSVTALYELEKSHILKTLEYFQGNKTKAANALGITIKTLYNKLSRYDNVVTH